MSKMTIVGAGAFGSALAIYGNRTGFDVSVWCFEKELPEIVKVKGENELYLPGYKIDPSIKFTNDSKEALDNTSLVLIVCPSAYVRRTSESITDLIPDDALIVSAAKGIENGTLYLMSQVLDETLKKHAGRISYVSGPSFAKDVASGLPTDIACASANIETARSVQKLLHSSVLRIYTQNDVIGTELGGALKNIIAVACGALDELKLGASASASLMTRGLAEITRLGVAMGANPLTFLGLAGVGDLILTCTGDLSRNRTLGKRIATGEKVSDIIASQKSVAEGYVTVKPAIELAAKYGIEMPICSAVYRVCYEGADIFEQARNLLERRERDELDGLDKYKVNCED